MYLVLIILCISCNPQQNKEITQPMVNQLLAADSVAAITITEPNLVTIYTKPRIDNDKPFILKVASIKQFEDSLNTFIQDLEKSGIYPNFNYQVVRGSRSSFLWAYSLFCFIFSFGGFVLFLIALIDVLKNNFNPVINKLIWVIVVILLPFIGPIFYFFIGRKQRVLNE